MHLPFLFSFCSLVPEVYQWRPLGCTQTQAWNDIEIRTTQDRLCHYCRYWLSIRQTLLFLFVTYSISAFTWRLYVAHLRVNMFQQISRKAALKTHLLHELSIIILYWMLSVKVLLWIVISVHSFLPDQTPTPTRFLKNCEEVGLFNELASSFEQDDDEKRAKNSVRWWGWWFFFSVFIFVCMTTCTTGYRNHKNVLQKLQWSEKWFLFLYFLPQVLM